MSAAAALPQAQAFPALLAHAYCYDAQDRVIPGAWSTAISQWSRWCRCLRFTIGPACNGSRN